ncbi:MAG: hypothetical protein AVDCRST_MAG85-407, partial [uncultured Solirubrobacteraceae bacterium]
DPSPPRPARRRRLPLRRRLRQRSGRGRPVPVRERPGRRDRGHLRQRRRGQVPGSAVQAAQPADRRRPQLPRGRLARRREARRRRGVVRGVDPRAELQRGAADVGLGLRDRRHPGEGVHAGRARRGQHVGLPPAEHRRRRVAAGQQRPGPRALAQRRDAAVQGQAGVAQQPPARARDPRRGERRDRQPGCL